MVEGHVVLGLLWIIYGVCHSVLATSVIKQFVQSKAGRLFKYYRLFYNLFAFATFAAIISYQFSIQSVDMFAPTMLTNTTGYLITTAGALLMLLCIKKYFLGLSGLQSFWREQTMEGDLHIGGIHRFVRHPLYLGTFGFIWGLFFIFPTVSLLISNTVITIYTLIGISFEERKLIKAFGESYKAYRKSVPMLIPRLPGISGTTNGKSLELADNENR